jgi:hypothetical protein
MHDIGTSPTEITAETQKGIESSGTSAAMPFDWLLRRAEHKHVIHRTGNPQAGARLEQNETRLEASAVQASQ